MKKDDSKLFSKVDFLKAGLIAALIIFGAGYPASEPNNPSPSVAVANNGISADVTGPSDFPNITIKNFGKMDDYFYRGAQPKPGDYAALAALGVKTIIDLRDDPTDYEKPDAESAHIRYVNIAMSDKRKPSDDQIAAFFAVADDESSRPFYVHCAGGRHRTGLIGAMYRYNKYGWDFDQVYREMKNYDYYSRWGHGAIKDYVQEYYNKIKLAKAALAPAGVKDADVATSQPLTPPPPPQPKE
jgi:protein tyrosine/serine phosphatase